MSDILKKLAQEGIGIPTKLTSELSIEVTSELAGSAPLDNFIFEDGNNFIFEDGNNFIFE